MLINPLSILYVTQAKQHEAERAAERHRLLQLCQQAPVKPERYAQMMAGLGRLLILIGAKLAAQHQPVGGLR
ncbi:MAG: hypothetical protein R2911_36110 [Caldilineaceae bacterium]